MSSTDHLCKQFGPRSGSKLYDTLIVFLKDFMKKVNIPQVSTQQQKHEKLTSMQRVNKHLSFYPSCKSDTENTILMIVPAELHDNNYRD